MNQKEEMNAETTRLNNLVEDLVAFFSTKDPEMAETWTKQVANILFSNDSELERIVAIIKDKYNKHDISISDNYVLSRSYDSAKQQKENSILAKIKVFFVPKEEDVDYEIFFEMNSFVDKLLEMELSYRKLKNPLIAISYNTNDSPDLKLDRIKECLNESDSKFESILADCSVYRIDDSLYERYLDNFADEMAEFGRLTSHEYFKISSSEQVQEVTDKDVNLIVEKIYLPHRYNLDDVTR